MNIDMESLIARYAEASIDDLDVSDLIGIVRDQIEERLSALPEREALEEIAEFHPDLLPNHEEIDV